MTTDSRTSLWRYAAAGLAACVIAGASVSPASAALVSVAGGLSSVGGPAAIIAAPSDALDDSVANRAMQGFNEAQGVTTSVAHSTDGGSIAAGTLVDSHMIFLNSAGNLNITHSNVVWTFSAPILGIMSDPNGNLEAASTFELGAPGTNYTVGAPGQAAPFSLRGLESNDSYSLVDAFTLQVSMQVAEPGDWIRVVTAHVPLPGAVWMFLSALGGLGLFGWRRRRMVAA